MIHAEHVFVTNSPNAIYSLQVQTFIPVYTYPYLLSHTLTGSNNVLRAIKDRDEIYLWLRVDARAPSKCPHGANSNTTLLCSRYKSFSFLYQGFGSCVCFHNTRSIVYLMIYFCKMYILQETHENTLNMKVLLHCYHFPL